MEMKTNLMSHVSVDEIGSGSRIKKCCELMFSNFDPNTHHVICCHAGNGVQRDKWRLFLMLLLFYGLFSVIFFSICHFQVKQPGALVAAGILLIAIVAKSLLPALGHLGWSETAKRPWWT